MFDPAFDPYPILDSGPGPYFTQPGFAYAPTIGTDFSEPSSDILCDIRQFGDVFHTKPLRTVKWHNQSGFRSFGLGALRDAMDAILAAHPDVTHFTFEPNTNINTRRYIGACGNEVDGLLYGYDEYSPIDKPSDGWNPHNGVITDAFWDIDGAPVDLAVENPGKGESGNPIGGDWFHGALDMTLYVGEYMWNAGAMQYVDDPGNFFIPHNGFSNAGFGSGSWLFLLRPSALTWTGQDLANTANRIMWISEDIAVGDVTETVLGHWGLIAAGHLSDIVGVRGWKLVVPEEGGPRSGTIAPGDPVAGRLRSRSTIRGRAYDAAPGISSPTRSGIGSAGIFDALTDPDRGIVRER